MSKLNHTLFFVEGNPSFEDADAAVLGVGFDESTSYGKGAADAPESIMKASHQIEIEQPLTGKTLQTAIHNFGTIKPQNAKEMLAGVEEFAKKSIDSRKQFILLGGDHSVVTGLLNAMPRGTAFVNFDAHLDLREEWQGKRLSHAAVSRRIFEGGFQQIWIGVRDAVGEEEIEFVSRQGLASKIFYCPTRPLAYYRGKQFPEWMKKKNMLFGGKIKKSRLNAILAGIESESVWLNIDVDCLDLGEGIETGTPMPFGLSLESLNELLYAICSKKKVVGFSIAELIPSQNNKSQVIGTMLCYNILSWQ